uniref:Zinc finger CCCH domain-containing protein 53 n=1 Tax=Anthurium amnicola TaxID=1678845 RepID=A0A1D1YC71_9ARAE
MDAYEATRIVLSRIQSLDPENASKIMGVLLIQDHGEKEMIRLAFGPEALLHSVVLKARKDLGLLPPSTPSTPSSPSPSPFLLARQNSASRLLGGGGGGGGGGGLPSPSSWAPPPVFSRSSSTGANGGSSGINGVVDDLQCADELISSNSSYGLSFLNDPTAASSPPNSIHALQIGPKGNGDLFYPDMAGDCRSPSSNGDGMLFPYAGMSWGMNTHHRRSYSAADRCLSSEVGSDFGWRPCLYFARGYCKNGSSCRFLHGLPDDATASIAGTKMDAVMEQQFHELLLRSKSQRLGSASQLMASAAAFPYSPTAASPSSGKCINFLLQPQQQQQSESQRVAAATAAALTLGIEEPHKFGRSRLERSDYAGAVNPGSRQIYLTFPADSTFREEDVANYFSIYGPVQDVRIPYQQKRMFGFVTFVYPETVKLILAKGNPHFVCDARVLVKPYKEKGKVPDKKQQQQQQGDRGVFSGCSTPTGLDSKDPYDLQLLGASMLYNSSQEVLLRKKLEEQQQAELQQAIELQRRRFMGLQLLDFKARNLSSPAVPVTSSLPSPSPINTYATGTVPSPNATPSVPAEGSAEELPPPEATAAVAQAGATVAATAAAAEKLNAHAFHQQHAVNAAGGADKEDSARDGSPKADGDFQESAEHNLPDSPFASPTKCTFAGDAFSVASEAVEASPLAASPNNNTDGCLNNGSNNNTHLITSSLLPAPSTLDMASFNSCFFPIPRFSSGHGAVGL